MITYEINFVCDGEELLGKKFPDPSDPDIDFGKCCHGVWCEGIFDRHDDPAAWQHAHQFGWVKLKGKIYLCPVCDAARKAGAK